jgi:hypothetical protein
MNDSISNIRFFFRNRRKLLVTGLLVFVLAPGPFLRYPNRGHPAMATFIIPPR